MAWQRIVLQTLLMAALAAAVARIKNIHTLQGAAGDQWHGLDDTQLLMMHQRAKWGSHDDSDYVEGVAVTEVAGHAAVKSGATDPGYLAEYHEEEHEEDHEEHEEDREEYHEVEHEEHEEDHGAPPLSSGWTPVVHPSSSEVTLECSDQAFMFSPPGPMTEVREVGGDVETVLVDEAKSCGYEVDPYLDTVRVPYTGCHGQPQTRQYTLRVSYLGEHGSLEVANLSCVNKDSTDPLKPRSSRNTRKAQNCAVSNDEQVKCGAPGITTEDCEMKGCCVGDTSNCYYPLDECTADRHFVFTIRSDSASNPIDRTKLVIPKKPNCDPEISGNSRVAIFKCPLTCARSFEVGNIMVYMMEVHVKVPALNLKYGMISRSEETSRFMIECRYPKLGSDGQPLPTTGPAMTSMSFQVQHPAPGVHPFFVPPGMARLPPLISQGMVGVELRLATDSTYSSYYDKDSLPLRLLLGAPVYLELNLKSPRPGRTELVVNYCLAFPRNARNALVLVYEGCANPNDPTVSILSVTGDPNNHRQRRFKIHAFQFMDVKGHAYLDEQIYFMCSTDVCMEKPCARGCFAAPVGGQSVVD